MPDPKDDARASGDIRAPEVEERGSTRPASRPEAEAADDDRTLADEARPGKGENQAGFLKDDDARGTS